MSSLSAPDLSRKAKKFPSLEKLTPYLFILPAGLF